MVELVAVVNKAGRHDAMPEIDRVIPTDPVDALADARGPGRVGAVLGRGAFWPGRDERRPDPSRRRQPRDALARRPHHMAVEAGTLQALHHGLGQVNADLETAHSNQLSPSRWIHASSAPIRA